MFIPQGWYAVTLVCTILAMLAMIGVLIRMAVMLARVQELLDSISGDGLPRFYAMTDKLHKIAASVDGIVAKVDGESRTALPKVEDVLDRVDHTMHIVEVQSDRVHHLIEGTSAGIQRVSHSPLTRTMLVGAGGLAIARLLKNAVGHFKWRRNGHRDVVDNGTMNRIATSS